MIFDVSHEQIISLGGKGEKLVLLLKKLLYAEAQNIGIPLRGVSVPLQINIADGGEDARILWTGGHKETDYLPSRFCVFQSKASKINKAGWKKEVWTKASQKKGAIKKLNQAVTKVIEEKGSYIGFTSDVLIGNKYDEQIEAIKQGIREAGGNPEELYEINIYDANKIANWASRHPAVAVWLKEQQSGLDLKNYQTIEKLGKKLDIYSISQVEDSADRFQIGKQTGENLLSFQKTKERISDYLVDPRKSIRIRGASGIGKTRFVYEIFRDETIPAKAVLSTSTIYCDLGEIGSQVFSTVQSFSESGSSALIIVDECPRETAIKLHEIITKEDSKLKLLTIGNDNQPIEKDDCLNISVNPAHDTLIEGIIRQRYPKANNSDIAFIKKLSGGYPRIAVLATDNFSEGLPILKSVEDVVDRILKGCGINRVEQVRAIECLALFKQLGADQDESEELDFVAQNLARQTGDEMYEYLTQATKSHLVDRHGRYFVAQPLLIAAFLGARRLDLLRVNTILHFIETAPTILQSSFLSQWQYFDNSKTAATIGEKLLASDGLCGSLERLNTNLGSQWLEALVHIDPDGVAATINRIFGTMSIDEVQKLDAGKAHLVKALGRLVFRQKTFHIAAQLLMLLAASEDKKTIRDATQIFTQLFYLTISGTEVEPIERFQILEQGLAYNDERIIRVCIEALRNTLRQDYTVWDRGFKQIGNRPPLKDWEPKTWDEVVDFRRDGLQKLIKIRSVNKEYANECEEIITFNIRSLLKHNSEKLFEDIKSMILSIVEEKGIWLDVIKRVSDWLYYDRKKAPEVFSKKVRKFYDEILPTDLMQKALLYTKFWQVDIHDPDLIYETDDRSTQDFEYSDRKAKEVAAEISINEELTYHAIQTMVKENLSNIFPFTHELARLLENPIETFQIAVNEFEKSTEHKGIQFIRGLIAGIDDRDTEMATKCIQIVRNSETLKVQMANILTAINISVERLNDIIQDLQKGSITASECVYFSYGKGLNHLNIKDVLPLINELSSNQETEGGWTSLEIIFMYQLDRSKLSKELVQPIKNLVVNPKLLQKTLNNNRGHIFEQLIILIHKHYKIDGEFADGLINQIIKLCQVEDFNIFDMLENNFKNIIKLLVKEKPILLWESLSRFFEIATSSEVFYLSELIGAPRNTFDGESHKKEGLLFEIPEFEGKYISWAKIDSEIRSPFLCIFYPIIHKQESGDYQWHQAIEKLTYEFGKVREFREALENRLYPSSYSDSIIPILENYLKLLQTWLNHPLPEMSKWVRDLMFSLERQIDRERKRYSR